VGVVGADVVTVDPEDGIGENGEAGAGGATGVAGAQLDFGGGGWTRTTRSPTGFAGTTGVATTSTFGLAGTTGVATISSFGAGGVSVGQAGGGGSVTEETVCGSVAGAVATGAVSGFGCGLVSVLTGTTTADAYGELSGPTGACTFDGANGDLSDGAGCVAEAV
jgi:pilus assembly protein FimV